MPTDVLFLIVLLHLRFKLSMRDFAEFLLLCGLVFSHQAVQNWEVKLSPLLAVVLRQRWGSKTGHSRSADETSLKVGGRWQYLCRATDSNRNLFDVYLSTTQSRAAADAFFRSAVAVTVIILKMITTHKYAGYLRALEQVFGDGVEHHPSTFKNNHLEQDRREVNGRPRVMGGIKSPLSAVRFCRVHDEGRNFLRSATRRKQHAPAAQRRAIHVQRFAALRDMLAVA
ncbi:DDE-type integrase/transposase/recombinase [Azospirillum sp. B21]|uniref:DDE-type integrase/transposase/recombinase n=1 Tax=Azospirillum sp. B21 TaxID=2607496 RepID=UPI0011EEF418|nr:DDE-type integrase/transposase/recombinase [Azospirillum sp. B21]